MILTYTCTKVKDLASATERLKVAFKDATEGLLNLSPSDTLFISLFFTKFNIIK
jgi:hypothetical protein